LRSQLRTSEQPRGDYPLFLRTPNRINSPRGEPPQTGRS